VIDLMFAVVRTRRLAGGAFTMTESAACSACCLLKFEMPELEQRFKTTQNLLLQ